MLECVLLQYSWSDMPSCHWKIGSEINLLRMCDIRFCAFSSRLLNQSALKQHSICQFIIFFFGFRTQLPDCFRLYLTYSNNYVNLTEEGKCFVHWNYENSLRINMTCNIHKIVEITMARLCTPRLSMSRQVHGKTTISVDFSAQYLPLHFHPWNIIHDVVFWCSGKLNTF